MSDAIQVTCHLIVGQKFDKYQRTAGYPTVRVAKTKVPVAAHEVPIRITLELPRALFLRPALEASIKVPAADHPLIIRPEVQENIASILSEQLGVTVRVTQEPEA